MGWDGMGWKTRMHHTLNRSASTAAAKVVDDGRITLNNAVNREVAPKPGIGDLLVLQALDGGFDRINSSTAGLEKPHGQASGTKHGQSELRKKKMYQG